MKYPLSARAACTSDYDQSSADAASGRRSLQRRDRRVGGHRATIHDGRREDGARWYQMSRPAWRHRHPNVGRARAREREASERRGGQAMIRLRRPSGIAAMSLLASAATASGECAWVFWLEAGDPRTHESSSRPVSGWGTREACEQALTQKLASDSEKNTEMDVTVDRAAGRPRLWVRRKGHSEPLAVYSYVCLPDIVDPRGPKGK